jgi:lipopolysaccharide transport system ATP-binding protein
MPYTAINVENLGKQYRLGSSGQTGRPPYKSLRESIATGLSASLRALRRRSARNEPAKPAKESFWALNDVSFEVKHGEVVGIIGRNGAGKSTLLKILSRITEPTTGRALIRGRLASLLEVGTGFHPELTGRENIFMNGSILGMYRSEIQNKFDEIVAFSGVERFLETPVKHYSSGMYVRLAFAVASHLEPEILIIDEVLAVGDAEFQKKCLGKMEDVAKKQGRTVIFVSHNMGAVRTLCSRAILLRNGELVESGPTSKVIESYSLAHLGAESTWERPTCDSPTGEVFFKAVEARVRGTQPGLTLDVRAEMVCRQERFPRTFAAIDLCDALGTPLLQAIPVGEPFLDLHKGRYLLHIEIDLPGLVPGRYSIDLWVGTHYASTVDHVKNVVAITVEESPVARRTFPHHPDHGFLIANSRCELECITNSSG